MLTKHDSADSYKTVRANAQILQRSAVGCRFNDGRKIGSFQGSAADQAAVNVRLSEKLFSVRC